MPQVQFLPGALGMGIGMSKKKQPSRAPRIANIDVVQVSLEGEENYRVEQINNISKSGVFIRTDSPFPISSRVNMIFSLVTERKEKNLPPSILQVKVKGEVVRHVEGEEKGASGPGMGIRFIDLDPKASQLLDEIVGQKLETTPQAFEL